jgi:hypothetical protein
MVSKVTTGLQKIKREKSVLGTGMHNKLPSFTNKKAQRRQKAFQYTYTGEHF